MKRGTPDHPKTLTLMRVLKLSKIAAVGILELLWHWTAKYAPRGDIGRFTNQEIADGVAWQSDADQLVQGLTDARFLDTSDEHRLVVHDWQHHADDGVKKFVSRNNLTFAGSVATSPDKSRHIKPAVAPAPCPLPLAPATAKEQSSSASADTTDLDDFKLRWSLLPATFPKVRSWSSKRKDALKTRLKDKFFRENWREALVKMQASSFCCGAKNWTASVDWFLQPDSVLKLIEGKYDDRAPSGAQADLQALSTACSKAVLSSDELNAMLRAVDNLHKAGAYK